MATKMTLAAFFVQFGLLLPTDKKIEQLRQLTAEDRAWFAERARIEHDIEIVSQSTPGAITA